MLNLVISYKLKCYIMVMFRSFSLVFDVTTCVFRVVHVDRMRICRKEMVLLSKLFMRVACVCCRFAQPTHTHVVGVATRVCVYHERFTHACGEPQYLHAHGFFI